MARFNKMHHIDMNRYVFEKEAKLNEQPTNKYQDFTNRNSISQANNQKAITINLS